MSKRSKIPASSLISLLVILLLFYMLPITTIILKPSLLQRLPNLAPTTIALWAITAIICLANFKQRASQETSKQKALSPYQEEKKYAWLKDAIMLSTIQLLFIFMVSGATNVSVFGNQALSLNYLLVSLFMAIYSALMIYFHYQLKLPALVFIATKAKQASIRNTVRQRAFTFILSCNNMVGVYTLAAISINYLLQKLFAALGQPLLLSSPAGLMILILLLLATTQPLLLPKTRKLSKKISLRNYQIIMIIAAGIVALFSLVNFLLIFFSNIFSIGMLPNNAKDSLRLDNFITLSLLLTPLTVSIFVKFSSSKNTFIHMILTPLLPLLIYLFPMKQQQTIGLSNSVIAIITVLLSLLFITATLNSKKTGSFISGALPLRTSKEISDTKSWRMINGHVLMLYGFSIITTVFPEKLTSILFTFAAMLLLVSSIGGTALLIRLFLKRPI